MNKLYSWIPVIAISVVIAGFCVIAASSFDKEAYKAKLKSVADNDHYYRDNRTNVDTSEKDAQLQQKEDLTYLYPCVNNVLYETCVNSIVEDIEELQFRMNAGGLEAIEAVEQISKIKLKLTVLSGDLEKKLGNYNE